MKWDMKRKSLHGIVNLLWVFVFISGFRLSEPVEVNQLANEYNALKTNRKYVVPAMTEDEPGVGKRVRVTPSEYAGSDVYYSLYLPKGHMPGKKYPVIVEFTGNYYPTSGSSGEAKDANLGYAVAEEIGAIWVVMPYITMDGQYQVTWWGDERHVLDFCIKNLRRVCRTYNGNTSELFICGFSRGAIGVNYLGLYDEEVADAWLGFFSHDHYDGVREWGKTSWGSPLGDYRIKAAERIVRLNGRASLISQNKNVGEIQKYICDGGFSDIARFTYVSVDVSDIVIPAVPNSDIPHVHTDKWLCYESVPADSVFKWFRDTLANKPGMFALGGTVRRSDGTPVNGVIVDSGRTHFAVTDAHGRYKFDGLPQGQRTVRISDENAPGVERVSSDVRLDRHRSDLDFIVRVR